MGRFWDSLNRQPCISERPYAKRAFLPDSVCFSVAVHACDADRVYVSKMTTERRVSTPADLGKIKFDPEYAREMGVIVRR